MDHHKHLVGLLLGEVAFVAAKLLELLHQVLASVIFERAEVLLESGLEVRVEDSEKQVHHEEQTEDQVGDEEQAVPSADLVGGKHHIRVV